MRFTVVLLVDGERSKRPVAVPRRRATSLKWLLRVHRSLTRGVLLGGFKPRDRARSHVELTAFESFSVFVVVYTERLDSTRDAEGVWHIW